MKRLFIYIFTFICYFILSTVNASASIEVKSDTEIIISQKKEDYNLARKIGIDFCLKKERQIEFMVYERSWSKHRYIITCTKNKISKKKSSQAQTEVKLSDFNDKHFEKLLEKDNMFLYPNTKKLLNELIINLTKYENTIKTDYNPNIINLLNKINENKEYTLTNNDFVNLKILESDFANISNENNKLYLIKRSKFLKDIQFLIDRGDRWSVLARLIQFLQTEDKLENIDGDTVYFIIKTLNPFNKFASINYLRNKILLNFFETKDTQIAKAEPKKKIEDVKKINENEKNLKVASSIECYNPNTDKIEIWINYKICPGNRTLVAEKEPSKPQKKIAKTNNSNQNEPIKKKVNADKEAPVIEIANTITVKDTTYEIAGMVKDKSDTVYIEIDGQTILAENGKFKFQKYSPVDHQLQIVAIDQWGNRSEPKIVDVKINIQVAGTSNVIEPLNPSKLRAKIDRNKVALVIGVEKYENSPSAKYASLDAKYFKDYARKVFGVREDNINLLTDEEANLSKTNSAFFKWLPSKIKSNQTDLIIFYAGHGLASTDGKEKYILPFNADPDLLSRTAISRNEIFDQIISLNPKSVTIFFDTCYSGVSRDEQMLLASARPLRVIADDEEQLPDNFTIFSASKNDQISSGLSDAKHGIFSYFLMKGLEGKADLNGDRKLTNNELLTYLDDNVSEKALDLGRQQNPTLSGNPDQILARY